MNIVRTSCVCLSVAALWCGAIPQVRGQAVLTPLGDMVVDQDALLMPLTSTYGRAINGLAFQGESLMTINGYQYATWYHDSTTEEHVYVGRRNLSGSNWEVVNSGSVMTNGDGPAWDAHNVISMGAGGDGSIHFSWDLHGHTLRYMNTAPGVTTNPGGTSWDADIFNDERPSLNPGGAAVGGVTYPQFVTHPTNGNVVLTYRTGSSGNGNTYIATYNPNNPIATKWDAPHIVIDGQTSIPYDDDWGNLSNERNAYINGIDIDDTGRIHLTWTWRETATGGSNHDIMYAYSDNGGATWNNNAGANLGAVMNLNSPGLIVVPMDRGNTLMNQQTQAVDPDGRVHFVMWYLKDGQPKLNGFTSTPSAYYHHFRDPTTGVWTRTALPQERAVGSRPDMAYDADGNIYVAYVSPGPGDGQDVLDYYTEGDLVIATASRAAAYTDWAIVHTDTRDFSGEPRIDQKRMTDNGVLSIILQENDDAVSSRTGTPIHVLEYNKLAKNLVWAGGGGATWETGVGTAWDSDGNNTGDAAFATGNRVTFDDGAISTNVDVVTSVSPSAMTFRNTVAKSYTVTGAPIGGSGGLAVTGGGNVTLTNGANTYTGATSIASGKLNLSGTASISASPTINVAAAGTLDVTGLAAGAMTLANQTLVIDGDVDGNVVATNNSTVHVNSINSMNGNLTIESGSLATGVGRVTGNMVATGGTVRVGGVGFSTQVVPVTTVIDNFNTPGLAQYTATRVNDNGIAEANVAYSDSTGALVASYAGTVNQAEQVLLLRGDSSLAIGQTLLVDVAMPTTTSQMDYGIAVSEIVNPTAASAGDTDTRDTFDWASIYIRPSANEIRNTRSINGVIATGSNVLTSVNETAVAQLLVERVSATTFTIGYINASSVRTNATTISFTENNIGTAIGFYVDLRANGGSLGGFDNLRIFDPTNTEVIDQTLTIDGNYTQAAGAVLEMEIYNQNTTDILDVGGILSAGGTLSVALAAGAPAPQAGHEFELFAFESLTGVFDDVILPTLGTNLLWDNTQLLSHGILKVVAGLRGDFDDNGKIDAADYVVWRDTLGAIGAGLLADGNADLHVDDDDYSMWRANFGNSTSGSSSFTGQVPEPSTTLLVAALLCAMLVCRVARP